MELGLIFSFLGASILLTIMPGPDILLVLTESISKGRRNGIALSVGLCTGVLIHTLAAATGLSLIIQNSDTAFQVLKWLGGGYLIYLGIQALLEKKQAAEALQKQSDYNFWSLAQKGFLMNVLNPKVSLFFIAFLPQFISPSGLNITVQMIILGGLFMTQALIIFSMVSFFSGGLSKYFNDDQYWNITKYAKAVILIGLGLLLILSSH